MTEPAILALEDGTVFRGISVGAPGRSLGEVVFNTAMTGYQEILTDPSYYRQIVTLTYPHIGNVGTNSDDFESSKVHAAGLVIRDLSRVVSNWRSELSLGEFLRRSNTVAIAEIDTRQLTRIIRDKGAQGGCILTGPSATPEEAVRAARKFPGIKGMDLARLVTTKQTYQWNQGSIWPERPVVYTKRIASFHVVAYDFGVKRNILRLLADHDCRITVVPATTTAEEALQLNPDGIFLSNGPGDPAETGKYAVPVIRQIIDSGMPTFGICLGHQMLGIAVGGKTVKMHQGHHGANHPVKDVTTGKVEI
ncbi:MAG: glutamine-hydrolyzing carbamoyl-phosphate synthase small subunit, partial [Gammaproteobacteria bacterium]